MNTTRNNAVTSIQISVMGSVTNLSSSNFALADGRCFLLKNETANPVLLEVQLEGMTTFVQTYFYSGWNPEIVKAIKININSLTLSWGY